MSACLSVAVINVAVISYEISRKSVQWEPRWYRNTDGRTDGRTDGGGDNVRFT